MQVFGVVEVGSTTIKGYGVAGEEIIEENVVSVKFKENYNKNGKFSDEDKGTLYYYVNSLKNEYGIVKTYGVGIFKNMSEKEKSDFIIEFYANTGMDFEFLSQEQEINYIIYGAISNIKYSNKLAVMVGGMGNSTEIAIVESGNIIEKKSSKIGVKDITSKYPDLKEDVVKSDFNTMVNEIKSLYNLPKNKSDVLILAGGNYIMFYENLKYPLKENIFFKDENEPYYLDKDTMDEYDYNYLYNNSLEKVKKENQDKKICWDYTRGMRLCIKVISDELNAKYIIPTKVSMVYGIISELKKEDK